MKLNWQKSESKNKPIEVDEKSSQSGIYLRTNIVFTDDKYTYDEAYLSKEEYSNYKLSNMILQKDTSIAYLNYETKLDTPVQYSNGHYYKPKWSEGTYAGLLQKGMMLPSLFPLKIWDSTELEENAVVMTLAELTALTLFLGAKQEQYFSEYKIEKAG